MEAALVRARFVETSIAVLRRHGGLKLQRFHWYVQFPHRMPPFPKSFDSMPFHFRITELAEVQSVAQALPAQVGTKKINEKAFFDVSTHFVALHFCFPR